MGSRSRRAVTVLPVGSTRMETKNPIVSDASVSGSFWGRAAGTSTGVANGFSDGSFWAVTEGDSTIRMTEGFVAGVGSGAAGAGAVAAAVAGVPAGGTEVSGSVVAGSAAAGGADAGTGVGVGAGV